MKSSLISRILIQRPETICSKSRIFNKRLLRAREKNSLLFNRWEVKKKLFTRVRRQFLCGSRSWQTFAMDAIEMSSTKDASLLGAIKDIRQINEKNAAHSAPTFDTSGPMERIQNGWQDRETREKIMIITIVVIIFILILFLIIFSRNGCPRERGV